MNAELHLALQSSRAHSNCFPTPKLPFWSPGLKRRLEDVQPPASQREEKKSPSGLYIQTEMGGEAPAKPGEQKVRGGFLPGGRGLVSECGVWVLSCSSCPAHSRASPEQLGSLPGGQGRFWSSGHSNSVPTPYAFAHPTLSPIRMHDSLEAPE